MGDLTTGGRDEVKTQQNTIRKKGELEGMVEEGNVTSPKNLKIRRNVTIPTKPPSTFKKSVRSQGGQPGQREGPPGWGKYHPGKSEGGDEIKWKMGGLSDQGRRKEGNRANE